MRNPSFAYLFERFPSFNQTFVSREVEEMARQGMDPLVISIRSAQERTANAFPPALAEKVLYLPAPEALEAGARKQREEHRLPWRMSRLLGRWGEAGDKMRVYEAAWLGPLLRERGIRHVHAHFAGIAARTAYWIEELYGIGFSFTGHANDIFRDAGFAVSLEKMIAAARFVVTASNFSRDWLVGKFPGRAAKIYGVYNGIDVGKFRPASRQARGDGPLKILSVGRYVEKKGFGYLMEACRLLADKGVPFHCEIVGEGPMQEELEARIAALRLEGKVVLAGPRSQAELIPLFASSDLFVLPCVRETEGGMDNLPTVIMEAMAAGLPVLSTNVAGVPEMIVDGRSGWIVPEKAPIALAETIFRIAGAPESAARCGEEGRLRALELFSSAITVRKLKHLLLRFARVRPGPEAFDQDPAMRRRLFQRWTGLDLGSAIPYSCDAA